LEESIVSDFEKPHSDFLNFFDGIKVLEEEVVVRFPAITRAIGFLRLKQGTQREETRIKCLLYIAIIFKDSSRAHYDLSWLNKSLEMTEKVWKNSVESLRWLLLQGMGRGPENPESLKRTEKLSQVATLLEQYPWRRMEDRLLNILLGGSMENAPGNSFSEGFP
jgi:hypothetical protein